MSEPFTSEIIYLGLLLIAIGGAFIISYRDTLGKAAQQAAIWVLIFVGTIGAYGLWEDISGDLTGRHSVINDTTVAVPRSRDGHYYLTLEVNDVPVEFVIDTGATQVVLTKSDARRIGLNPDELGYFGSASTANGIVNTALISLDTVALDNITDFDVPAVVTEGQMVGSLLGMTYLGLFDRIEISNGRLVLRR